MAILPGVGISFISPIYDSDYGLFDDNMELPYLNNVISESTNSEFQSPDSKFLLVFFTPGCPHCKAASTKLGTNLEAGQQIPVHAVFPEYSADTETFLQENNGLKFSSHHLADSTFVWNSGPSFPSIFLMNSDGSTEKHWSGDMINFSALDYLASIEP